MRGDDHMTGKREIFGTDGVRGLANAGAMTPDNILRLGMAVGRVFKNGAHRHRVVIGKDTRLSGYMIEPALTAGFAASGHGRVFARSAADACDGNVDDGLYAPISE